MDENNQDGSEVLETTEEVAEETIETPEESAEDRLTRIEAEKAELEAKNKQLYERAKKAEEAKKAEPSNETNLSPKDFLALTEHKVSSEDFDEVIRVAKILDKPVHEALRDATLKTILEQRTEERRTASATNTRGSSRGAAKVSGDDLLRRAEATGEVPDSDEGMRALALARAQGK
ncbi:hypothetical protein C4568_03745 [Candidatus Parcubacteria bacterium]|nr:MAG: hypothetical protein C4568_03745 [Candidatus Parcubacteria bacterium]